MQDAASTTCSGNFGVTVKKTPHQKQKHHTSKLSAEAALGVLLDSNGMFSFLHNSGLGFMGDKNIIRHWLLGKQNINTI